MSLRKRCSPDAPIALPDGTPNPLHCPTSPRCDHQWFADFRVNGRRYRASCETADKGLAKSIEATERTRVLQGRHGIRRQPDVSFTQFAARWLKDYAVPNKRSADRDAQIIDGLNRAFGHVLLSEITGLRLETWKRERLAGKWKANGQLTRPNPLKPGTVNRELDTLRSILSKAVEWKVLLENPANGVKRLKVDNRRTRVLSQDEQDRLLAAAPRKMRALIALGLITGVRVGELLGLTWPDVSETELTFLETKNGTARRLSVSPAVRAILDSLTRGSHVYVFTNTRTGTRYTVNGARHIFRRAVTRAGIEPAGDVTLHTLRHTALTRMITSGSDTFTVMAISGHSSVRMLERYTHPGVAQKLAALESGAPVGTIWAQLGNAAPVRRTRGLEKPRFAEGFVGGRQEARTPDLRVANAALSQLS